MAAGLAEHAAKLLDLTLTPEQVEQFGVYARALAAWNAHTNLTAITDPEAVQVRHFLDSLTLVKAAAFPPGCRVIDVGSGAGFPGLPLAIVFPDMHMTLLEATGKKVAFLNHIIDTLGLKHTRAVQGRAEEAGQSAGHRAAYDVVLARAVARLPALAEYMLPLAKVGGRCIAMKGKTAEGEAADAERALSILGGRLEAIHTVQLPGVDEMHYLVVLKKIVPTPTAYPRKPGTPTNRPLS
jgi:16S rRNA (guanine527-N7)-methyltransferase